MKQKPYTTYPGGKEAAGTFQTLINRIIPHDIYIDGCLGNSAILRHKKPAPVMNIGVDINPEVIAKWSEWIQFSYFFYCEDIVDFLEAEIINLLMKARRIFIYLDPPFMRDQRRDKRARYPFEMLETSQHERLLQCARKISDTFPQRVFFMISTYDNDLYRKILEGWETQNFMSKTRRGSVRETIYMNYPTPTELHDYSHLGSDYRERWRIKERVERNVSRLEKMDILERNAIITAIKEADKLQKI